MAARTRSSLPVDLAHKVANPTLTLLAAGVVLTVAGILSKDPTLRTLGYAALGSALTTLGVGFASPPDRVQR